MYDKSREKEYAAYSMKKYGLKSCPFCGGLAYLEKKHRAFVDGQTTIVTFVRCIECNARSGRERLSDYGRTAASAEAINNAIKNWNKRES